MNHFDRLPNELVFIIFKKLNLSDLFNLRIVNKRFKSISEQSANDLVVAHNREFYGNCWFLTYDLKSLSRYDTIKPDRFSSFRNLFQLEFSINRLYLNINDDEFDFLEDFKQLEHLELVCKLFRDKKLNLPKLNTLLISLDARSRKLKLILESKKLKSLYLRYCPIGEIEIVNPEQVQYLRLATEKVSNIEQFNNLQHLCFVRHDESLTGDILSKFRKLKVLECDLNSSNRIEEVMVDILKQRKVLRRIDLTIRINDVKIQNAKQLSKELKTSRRFFRINNYGLISGYLYNWTYLNECEIVRILEHFNGRFPQSLFEKKHFNVEGVLCEELGFKAGFEDSFSLFLNSLLCLRELWITDCKFSQSFYDKLDCKYMNHLYIVRFDTSDTHVDEPYNFDFVFKFKELISFYFAGLEFKNLYDFAVKIFKQSKLFSDFEIKDMKDIVYNITKPCNTYEVRVFSEKFDEQGDYHETRLFSAHDLNEADLVRFLSRVEIDFE